MNGALKSFSLNNLFSCELAAVTQMDSENGCERQIVHNLFLYISNAKKERKNEEKNEKSGKKERKKTTNSAKRKKTM